MAFLIGPSFPFLFFLLFVYEFFVFGRVYRRSDNLIAHYIQMTLLYTAAIFFLFSVPILLFPSGSTALTWSVNVFGYFVSYIAIAYFAMNTSPLIFPRIPSRWFFVISFSGGVFVTAINILTLQPATVNEYGIVARHIPVNVLLFNNFLITFSFLPACISLIIQASRGGQILKGIFLGVGVALLSLFLPLSLQTQEMASYIFFNLGSLLGGVFMLLSPVVGRSSQPIQT